MKHIIRFLVLILIFTQCRDTKSPPSDLKGTKVPDPKSISSELWSKSPAGAAFSNNTLSGGSTTNTPETGFKRGNSGRTHNPHQKSKSSKKTESGSLRSYNSGARSGEDVMNRVGLLRLRQIPIDMNEPLNRRQFDQPVENGSFISMITLSDQYILEFDFDNDILDYTDRFYTNGISIGLTAPWLHMNPARFLMVPYWSSAINYYSLSIVQNMYTPSTTKTGGILYGDRPYAAYLYLASKKISNDRVHRFRQSSELDLGIIGPDSYGGWVQQSFHKSVPSNHEPLGWEYQIQNDLVFNYTLNYQKGVVDMNNFDLVLSASTQVGTLYTNTSGGLQMRAGWFNPFFANLGFDKKSNLVRQGLRRNQLYFFIKGSGKLVGYDATLQGGLFNSTSVYTLPASDISRLTFQSSAGVTASLGGFEFNLEQFLLSPEFSSGLWHKWVHISLAFSF